MWDHDGNDFRANFMNWIMDLHTGDFSSMLGFQLFLDWQTINTSTKTPYCILLSTAVTIMALTGINLWQTPSLVLRNRNRIRIVHHIFSAIVVLWLVFTAITGQLWALSRWWIGDASNNGDMILLLKQLHVGYVSLFGLTQRLETMKWWSIVGGCSVFLLTSTGLLLFFQVHRAVLRSCGKKKRK